MEETGKEKKLQRLGMLQTRKNWKGQRMCNAMLPCIVCSVVTSVITTKILAVHYFKIIDDYVEDMTRMTKEFVDAMKRRKE